MAQFLRHEWALGFKLEHARFYGPASLVERVLSRCPSTLNATVLRFLHHEQVAPVAPPAHALLGIQRVGDRVGREGGVGAGRIAGQDAYRALGAHRGATYAPSRLRERSRP